MLKQLSNSSSPFLHVKQELCHGKTPHKHNPKRRKPKGSFFVWGGGEHRQESGGLRGLSSTGPQV